MEKPEYLRFHKADLLAIFLVVALAVFVAFLFLPQSSGQGVQAQIYQNGELVKTLSLEEDTSLEVGGQYTNVITVEKGKIAITDSDCPGRDCVHSGAISSSGRSIVCLPNAVEVRVIKGQSDVDFVVG